MPIKFVGVARRHRAMGTGNDIRGTEVLERENHKLRKDLEALEPGTAEHREAKARLDEVTLALIEAHRDVIDGVARAFSRTERGRRYKEDIESAATLGFIVALTTHDPDRGPLGYLAQKRVRTEVSRLVRQTERPWLSSRKWRSRHVAVTLSQQMPIHKVAKELGIKPSEVTRLIGDAVILSLGTGGSGTDLSLNELKAANLMADHPLDALLDGYDLDELLAILSPSEVMVLKLRYLGRPGTLVRYEEMASALGTSREWCRRRTHSATRKVERWLIANRPELVAGRQKVTGRAHTRAASDDGSNPINVIELLLVGPPSAQFEHTFFKATA